MPTTPTVDPAAERLAALDADIFSAYRDLQIARAAFYLNPSGAIVDQCERAEVALNQLLEQRHALRRRA